jgi:hypothetical protein
MKDIPGMMRRSRFSLAACLVLVSVAASASAPAGRYTVTLDSVTDHRTYLMWQRNAPAVNYTWASAQACCSGLSLEGWSNWRLPNVKELQSLVDFRGSGPMLDATAFAGSPGAARWSITPAVYYGTSRAWVVNFDDGRTYEYQTALAERTHSPLGARTGEGTR